MVGRNENYRHCPKLPPEPGLPEEQLTVYRAQRLTLVLELPAGFRDRTGLNGDSVEYKGVNIDIDNAVFAWYMVIKSTNRRVLIQ